MKRGMKKTFSFILVLALVLSLIPAPVAMAADFNGMNLETSADSVTTVPNSLAQGQVWTDKSVVDKGNGTFEITLKAMGREYESTTTESALPVDVILVLDESGSMSGNKISSLKTAAKQAVTSILGANPANRVAIVSYSSSANLDRNFTRTTSGTNGLNTAIDNLSANGATNIQNAILIAQNAINGRADKTNKPIMILMSDGEPTYYHTSVTSHTFSDGWGGTGNRNGNGSNGGAANVNWTIQQAMVAKNAGTDIYTIGFGVTTDYGKATLMPRVGFETTNNSWFPTEYKYWSEGSSLTNTNLDSLIKAFADIISHINGISPLKVNESAQKLTDVVLTDVIGSGFEVVGTPNAGTGNGTVTLVGSTLTWTIPGAELNTVAYNSNTVGSVTPNTLTFTVKLKDSVTAGTYFTNSSASSSFTASDGNPYYKNEVDKNIGKNLTNKGKAILTQTNVDVSIKINKRVTGPVEGTNTFNFGIYDNPDCTGTPITTASITVTGEASGSTTVSFTVEGLKFTSGSYTVYVKELGSAPEFWTYDANKKSATLTKVNPSGEVSFTNKYEPKGTLVVEKAWTGPNVPVTEIQFNLLSREAGTEAAFVADGVPRTLKADNNWKTTISGLDISKEYSVSEIASVQDYFAVTSPGSIVFEAGELTQKIVMTNNYITPTGEITIIKNWIGVAEEDLPSAIFFDYDNGTTTGTAILTDADAVTASTGAAFTWEKTVSVATFGTYDVTERAIQDFTADATTKQVTIIQEPLENRSGSVTFNNTYVEPKGKLTIVKEWDNEGTDTRFRPDSITVKVFQTLSGQPETQYGSDITLNEGNYWTKELDNLAFGDYRVEEITQVADYATTYSALRVTLSKDVDSREGNITITNTFLNPTGEITVTKTWVESGLENTDRPSEITITLYRNGSVYDSTTFGAVDQDYTFTNLPLDGVYTVEESASGDDAAKLAVYDQEVAYPNGDEDITLSKDVRGGEVQLTNTNARGTITVNKIWKDSKDPDKKPKTADFTLYQVKKVWIEPVTEDVEDPETEEVTTITKEEGRFDVKTTAVGRGTFDRTPGNVVSSFTFYDLELGEDIYYYAEEEEVAFYSTEYSVKKVIITEEKSNKTITITNSYKDPKGSLTVYKVWKHGNNPNPAKTVTVELYKKGNPKAIDSATFEDSHTFRGLKLGKEYYVKEVPVDKYMTQYDPKNYSYKPVKNDKTGKVESGEVTITNTYIPETGKLKVEKKWEGKKGNSITVTLTRYYDDDNGLAEDTSYNKNAPSKILSGRNDWKTTFSNLEVYGPGGNKYVYRVIESGADLWEYNQSTVQDVELTAKMTSKIVITNTYAPDKGTLTIEKQWVGGNDYPNVIEYKLYINGKPEEGNRQLSAADGWKDTLTGLDVTKTYTIKEVKVPEEYTVKYKYNDNHQIKPISFEKGKLTGKIKMTNTRTNDKPEISLTKEAGKSTAILKDGKAEFTYTLTIQNTGNRTLKDIYILDEMTAAGSAVGATITYVETASLEQNGDGARITPEAITLAPGATTSAVYTVIVDKTGDYENLATVYGYYGNTEVTDSDTEAVWVKDLALVIDKVIKSSDKVNGTSGIFIFGLTVRNAGTIDLFNVIVEDVMTSDNTNATITYSYEKGDSGITFDPDTKTFEIGYLPAGEEEVVITYSVSVSGQGQYNNIATVTGEYEEDGGGTFTDNDNETVNVVPEEKGGGGKDKGSGGNTKTTSPGVTIPEQGIPAGPVLEGIIQEEEEIPGGDLPKTGGTPAAILIGLGALLAGGGLVLRRKGKVTGAK